MHFIIALIKYSIYGPPNWFVFVCVHACELSHHIGLSGLFDVMSGDDDRDLSGLHDFHQMLPDPKTVVEETRLRKDEACHQFPKNL